MIIGAELFYNLLCIGQIKLNDDNITLQKTRLAWIVTGRRPRSRNTSQMPSSEKR